MPPPGRPILPSSSLQDARGANDLYARRVLCPADRIADGARALAARIVAQQFRRLHDLFGRAAADLRTVSGV